MTTADAPAGPDRAPTDDSSAHGPAFWVALGVGAGLMAWGARLYLDLTPDTPRRIDFALWLVGADLVHDALVAPVVGLLGVLVVRTVPARWRAPVQAGLLGSAFVLVVAWLPLHRTADVGGNATVQPLDYPTAVAWVLATVWALVAVVVLAGRRRATSRARRASTPPAAP